MRSEADDELPPLDDLDDRDRERAVDMLDSRPAYGIPVPCELPGTLTDAES